MRAVYSYIISLVLYASASSCCRCDIHCQPDIPDGDLTVMYDWSLSPDAHPEGMAILLYPVADENTRPWRHDVSPSGGKIEAPAVPTRAITFNNGTESVLFDHENNFFLYRAYTDTGNLTDGLNEAYSGSLPASRHAVEERVVRQPDMLWRYAAETMEVTGDSTTFVPIQAVARYSYTVTGIEGLDGVARCCAAITGLTPGILMHSGEAYDTETVTLPGKLQPASTTTATGDILTFGYSPVTGGESHLQLLFWLTDGMKFCYDFNVTGQIVSAADKLNVSLTVGNISLPAPEKPGHGPDTGGIGVDVDNWETIEIELSN